MDQIMSQRFEFWIKRFLHDWMITILSFALFVRLTNTFSISDAVSTKEFVKLMMSFYFFSNTPSPFNYESDTTDLYIKMGAL